MAIQNQNAPFSVENPAILGWQAFTFMWITSFPTISYRSKLRGSEAYTLGYRINTFFSSEIIGTHIFYYLNFKNKDFFAFFFVKKTFFFIWKKNFWTQIFSPWIVLNN